MSPRLSLEALLIRELIVLAGDYSTRLLGNTRGLGDHDALEGIAH